MAEPGCSSNGSMPGRELSTSSIDDSLLQVDSSVFADCTLSGQSVCSDVLLEDSFSAVLNGFAGSTSTPSKTRKRPNTVQPEGEPRNKGRKGKDANAPAAPRLQCDQCTNTYANERTLAVHRKMHSLKGAASRAPSPTDLSEAMPEVLKSCIVDMGKKNSNCGELSKKFKTYCDDMLQCVETLAVSSPLINFLSQQFSALLGRQNVLLPSALRSAAYIGANKMMSESDTRSTLKDILLTLQNAEDGILNLFVGSLILTLTDKVIVFSLKKMRGVAFEETEEQRQQRSSDDFNSENFFRLVYHIGGSVVNGFLWRGSKYGGKWPVYVSVLSSKFLRRAELLNQCSTSVRAFTDGIDRGKLKHINQDAFDFFHRLFVTLMTLEGENGSLPLKVVTATVLADYTLICLWDVLVGIHLTPEQSSDLLLLTSHCAARIVSKGILKRRLNEHLKKSYTSVSLRARLAN